METDSKLAITARSFSEDHQALDRAFERLVTRAAAGDSRELRDEWTAFEERLSRHLDLEERHILPAFSADYPEQAAILRREHEEIRASLVELGIRLDLHYLRSASVERFVAALRDHAAREDAVLHPWIARHLPAADLRSLELELGRAA
jgi:hemerythrin-like domain-containing protein